jgi:hypothetical protein
MRNDPGSPVSVEAKTLSDKFAVAQTEAARLRNEARVLGRTIAEGDVIDATADKKYRELVVLRDRAIHEVGRLVLEWSRLGGIVSLDRVVSKETPPPVLRVVEEPPSASPSSSYHGSGGWAHPSPSGPPPLTFVGFDPDTTAPPPPAAVVTVQPVTPPLPVPVAKPNPVSVEIARLTASVTPLPPVAVVASKPVTPPLPAPVAKPNPVSAEIERLRAENEKLRLAKEAREKKAEVKAAVPAPKKPASAKPVDASALLGFGHAGFVKPPPFSAADLFRSLPSPEPTKDKDTFNAAMKQLGAAVEGANANWPSLSPELQRQSISYCAAYARHLQDSSVILGRPLTAIEIPRIFSTLTAYTRDHRPGFSRGLARDVIPQTETWLSDARQWWAYLHGEEPVKPMVAAPLVAKPSALPPPPVKVVVTPPTPALVPKTILRPAPPAVEAPASAPALPSAPEKPNPEKALSRLQEVLLEDDDVKIVESTLAAADAGVSQTDPRLVRLLLGHADTVGHPRLRVLRKAIREAWTEMTGDAPEGAEDEPEVEWKHLGLTKGKHVVLLGADERQNTRESIRETFQFGVLDWPPTANNRTDAVAARVRSGTVDMVILLAKFCSHSWQEKVQPACKAKGIPFVVVSNGYGTSAIQRGIEAALGLKD